MNDFDCFESVGGWHTFHNGHQCSRLDIVYTKIRYFEMASSHNRLLLRFDYHKPFLSVDILVRNCFLRLAMDKHIVYNRLVFPFWHFHKIHPHIDRIWNGIITFMPYELLTFFLHLRWFYLSPAVSCKHCPHLLLERSQNSTCPLHEHGKHKLLSRVEFPDVRT